MCVLIELQGLSISCCWFLLPCQAIQQKWLWRTAISNHAGSQSPHSLRPMQPSKRTSPTTWLTRMSMLKRWRAGLMQQHTRALTEEPFSRSYLSLGKNTMKKVPTKNYGRLNKTLVDRHKSSPTPTMRHSWRTCASWYWYSSRGSSWDKISGKTNKSIVDILNHMKTKYRINTQKKDAGASPTA